MILYRVYLDTYADLTFLFFSEVYDLFQLLCTKYYIIFCLLLVFRSRAIGACPVTTDCIVAMS